MAKKAAYVLIIILSVFIIGGIVLGEYVLKSQDDFTKNITLTGEGAVSEDMDFSLEGFYPGYSAKYTIKFGSAAALGYDAAVSFEEDGDCSLSEYVRVKMTLNGNALAEGTLESFLSGDSTSFTLENLDDGGAILVLEYSMPADVGNEAQGTVANFKLSVTAQAKG